MLQASEREKYSVALPFPREEREATQFSRPPTVVPVLSSGGSSSLSTLVVAGGRGVAGNGAWTCIAVA